ncbi:cytochrome b [Amorphus sp. 3PC139-8]|uniref:cytochrome b n=1 Tax=Amorphus sp. 3PC139-8 TaxID=2735676 RepID=UPI00345DEAE0
MRIKSSPERYGVVAIALHWTIAVLLLVALASGFAADSLGPGGAGPLALHAASGILAAILMVVRLLWWWSADTRPAALAGPAKPVATATHVLLQLIPLALAFSGAAMLVLSGTLPALIDGGPLLDFSGLAARGPHGIAARLLIALIVLHVAGALYHHVRLKDSTLARMGIGTARF